MGDFGRKSELFFILGLQYMNTALQYDPTHTEALLNSAILIQVNQQIKLLCIHIVV